MIKRLLKKFQFSVFLEPFPKFRLGSFLVAILCSFLIVMATFTPIPLKILAIPSEALFASSEFFANLNSIDQITRVLIYIPQIPVIIFIASLLGPRIGMFSVFLYVATGLLGIPIFASGGGVEYLSRLGFGYILGFFAGIFVTGHILSKEPNKTNILRAAFFGVLAIHLIGICYLGGMLLIRSESFFSIFGWAWQLSGIQILYDILFAIMAAFLGRFFRKILWIAMD